MIVYVTFAQKDERPAAAAMYARHAERFEETSGLRCLIVPFDMAGKELMSVLKPTAVVLSGFSRSFQDYPPGALDLVVDWLLHAPPIPTLAICGSHQLIGYVFNGELQPGGQVSDRPMRVRRRGGPIVNPDYHPEYFMERGFYELQIAADDPLFSLCGRPPVVMESHYCEVKTLPPGFRLLASTPECRIQAMRHEKRPLIGVQFHPEEYTDRFPDGKHILQAFFREAVEYTSPSKRGVH